MSSIIHYIILFGLGLSLFIVDKEFDEWAISDDEYDLVVLSYSNYLDHQIAHSESGFLNYKSIYSPIKEGLFDTQDRIMWYFNEVLSENDDDWYQRLNVALDVLHFPSGFSSERLISDEIGLSVIDAKRLYLEYLSPLNYSMCMLRCSQTELHTNFDEELDMYITKLAKEEFKNFYSLSYEGISYRLDLDQVDIVFTQRDMEHGYAQVNLKNLMTNAVKTLRIEIPKFAFNY